MENLCKYRHIFGVEGTGAHSIRLFDIAVVDLALTILGAWAIARAIGASFWVVFIVVMVLGTLIHRAFCVQTTLTKMVFGSGNN